LPPRVDRRHLEYCIDRFSVPPVPSSTSVPVGSAAPTTAAPAASANDPTPRCHSDDLSLSTVDGAQGSTDKVLDFVILTNESEFAPGVQPPESVRACGAQPWSKQVTEDELPAAIEEFVRDQAGREGTSVVIGPPGVPGAVVASETKGLEFDAVLVVKPERILATGPRGAAELYVAPTRATQRLGVLHQGPLPQALTGLAETGTPAQTGNQRLT
jgi:hypothetical protein